VRCGDVNSKPDTLAVATVLGRNSPIEFTRDLETFIEAELGEQSAFYCSQMAVSVKFEVLTTVNMNRTMCLDVTSCSYK
jgi:hypothetical protein